MATLSAAEQGAVDAQLLTVDILALYDSEDNNIASAANREFVKHFIAKVVAPAAQSLC